MLEVDSRFKIKSEKENKYTSTGIKFWRHKDSLEAYRDGNPNSIISTHVSPEGSCNLACPYCSVTNRKRTNRIEFDVIKKYILSLKKYGLKAVILTGGGEPTLYPRFNELVRWLREENLEVALITNGTNVSSVDRDVWETFAWVRISINIFPDYQERIKFPDIPGVLGASMVYIGQTLSEMKELADFIDKDKVKYIRVLPNCLLKQDELIEEHNKIEKLLHELGDERFFQQFKIHGAPCSEICHQAYFRPYLSEVNGGTVFPCDSLVLNNEQAYFSEKYAICAANDIEKFLNREIYMTFNAKKDCEGCVFSRNIEILDEWFKNGINHFNEYTEALVHENFV